MGTIAGVSWKPGVDWKAVQKRQRDSDAEFLDAAAAWHFVKDTPPGPAYDAAHAAFRAAQAKHDAEAAALIKEITC